MSISSRLIRLVEDIELDDKEFMSGAPVSGSAASDMSGMVTSGLGYSAAEEEAPAADDFIDLGGEDDTEDFDTPDNSLDVEADITAGDDISDTPDLPDDPMSDDLTSDDGSTISIATPKGTSVTVTERCNSKATRRGRMSEGFFKTKSDIENHYNGDNPLEVFRKREESGWLNEADEEAGDTEEEADDFMMETTSGSDGRRVTGTLSDDSGNQFDIDGTLAFSGDQFEIEDVNLDAVTPANAEDEEAPAEESEESDENQDGLKKTSDSEVVFEERLGKNLYEDRSLISNDPIGDLLNLRNSNREVPSHHAGRPHKEPVKKVHNNSLKHNRELDIKKVQQGLSDLKAGKYQTATPTEE